MKKSVFIFCMLCGLSLSSCTDAKFEKMTNFGNHFTIEMYSGGQLVRSWESSGKVSSEKSSDGYYFKDAKTGKLVEVSGDVVITNID